MFKCCLKLKRGGIKENNKFSNTIFPKNQHYRVNKSLLASKYKINPINEIPFNTKNICKQLGEGGSSIVYKYVYNNRIYACKKISRNKKTVEKEIMIMSLYNDNKYIVKYFNCHLNDNSEASMGNKTPIKPHYIFMEYCRGKELFERLTPNMDYKLVNSIIYQLLLALKHLQKYNIVHADLKLENIIINNRNEIKLIDFGLSNVITSGSSIRIKNYIGTIGYVSPEVMIDNYITRTTDVWSVGIITYMLLNNRHLFDVVNRQTYKIQLRNLQDTLIRKGLRIYNNSVPVGKYNSILSFFTKTICYSIDRLSVNKCLKIPMLNHDLSNLSISHEFNK